MRRRTNKEFGRVLKLMERQFRACGHSSGMAAMKASKLLPTLDLVTAQFTTNTRFIERTGEKPAPAKPMPWCMEKAA